MDRLVLGIYLVMFLLSSAHAQNPENRITTQIDTIEDNRLILVQKFTVQASLNKVWKAYTTKEGWESWAVPLAEIDWKINGTIKTNYNQEGTIGDVSTIVTHIVNYIPYQMITLQAEITENFPAFMKEDEKALFNIIKFDKISDSETSITSYGIGYKNNEKYQNLMTYFIQANEQTQKKLIAFLENNK